MIPFSSDLTKISPPTWKAEVEDPQAGLGSGGSIYDEHSVAFWIRVGNIVWFSVSFVFNSAFVVPHNIGEGAYYWAPTLDGAPAIDSALYNEVGDRAMVCGKSAILRLSGSNPYYWRFGQCEIGPFGNRIYARLHATIYDRIGPTTPFVFDEDEGFVMTGKYVTSINRI